MNEEPKPARGTDPQQVGLLKNWVHQRGLWVIGDVLMILIGTAAVIYSIAHLLGRS